MFQWGECTESFNPQVLYTYYLDIGGSKNTHKFTYHCHDFVELSIVVSGQVPYHLEGKDYTLKKGDILISNPGFYHVERPKEDSKFSQLHIGINNFKLSKIRDNYIDNKGRGPILTLKKYESEILKCCDEIIKEEKSKKLGYPLVLKSLVMKLLILLYRDIEDDSANEEVYHCSFESTEKQNIVKSIMEYMSSNYMEDISLDKISKNMYLSPVYISKIFKEETGDSPINHLIKIRLAKAEQLLKEKSMPIKAVAQSVGYNDAYHFSKLFKKYYGISPSKV